MTWRCQSPMAVERAQLQGSPPISSATDGNAIPGFHVADADLAAAHARYDDARTRGAVTRYVYYPR